MVLPAAPRSSNAARPTTAGYSVRAALSTNAGDATARHDPLNATAPGMLQKNPPQIHSQDSGAVPSFETIDNNNIDNSKPSYLVSYDAMAELEELRARVNEEEVGIIYNDISFSHFVVVMQ